MSQTKAELVNGLSINAAAADTITVDSAGRVGINDSSPSKSLDITGESAGNGEINVKRTSGATCMIQAQAATAVFGSSSNHKTQLKSNGTTALTIDTSQNVGIGTSSPSDKLHVRGASAAFTAFILDNATNSSSPYKITYGDQGQVNHLAVANREMTFGTNNTERMRITEAGQLQIGTTASGGPGGVTIIPNNSQGAASILFDRANTSGTSTVLNFENNNTTVGSISHGNSSTAYNTSSDYRLKENATAISDGITRLKTLKPYRFNFIIDADKTVDGFFAHEVTAVPEAITGTKDEIVTQSHVDSGEYQESELGNPIYQGIDQSKLVPLLVAAVKELITKVETLEAA